jgi:hypothetical protein
LITAYETFPAASSLFVAARSCDPGSPGRHHQIHGRRVILEFIERTLSIECRIQNNRCGPRRIPPISAAPTTGRSREWGPTPCRIFSPPHEGAGIGRRAGAKLDRYGFAGQHGLVQQDRSVDDLHVRGHHATRRSKGSPPFSLRRQGPARA